MQPQLFVKQLTVIDCALLVPARGLVGASWIVDVVLAGELNSQGMLFDFGPAKREIKRIIDAQADHKLILAQADTHLQWQQTANDVALDYVDEQDHRLSLHSPRQAFCVLPGNRADKPVLARLLENEIAAAMPANVQSVQVQLHDEAIDGVAYAYCHGLKKHDGNCQRIAHGHRSRIEIFANGQRRPAREKRWAERWQDIYLGNREDLQSDLQDARYRFAYTAEQGRFEIELDASRCVLLNAESTVENIAMHIAKELNKAEPKMDFEVHAYEGVNKGAIAQL